MLDAFIYDGLRTPIGRHAGNLAAVRPDDLAAEVIREVVARNALEPREISDVVLGCVNQAGEDNRNVARFAALLSGLPPTTPGVTVNRLCASGLQAVIDSARAITVDEGELYIAGGVESMSRAPYVMGKSDSPYSREVKLYDSTIGTRFPNPRFIKQFGDHSMPQTGDNVAKDFGITREQADEFALASQQKYATAEKEGFFSQVLGCLKLMSVDFKDPRVNPNGGAIAIGHPLGASGARLALTGARELQQSGARYAAVSLCIGVGQGLAVILERTQP